MRNFLRTRCESGSESEKLRTAVQIRKSKRIQLLKWRIDIIFWSPQSIEQWQKWVFDVSVEFFGLVMKIEENQRKESMEAPKLF